MKMARSRSMRHGHNANKDAYIDAALFWAFWLAALLMVLSLIGYIAVVVDRIGH
jgi:hypothetical protein